MSGAMWLGRTALGEMGVVEILGYVSTELRLNFRLSGIQTQ